MKCIYYLSPNLVSTHKISDDLHDTGVDDWFIHIISKNEAGISREQLHSSNYIETLDLIREGILGALIGFSVGLIACLILNITQPFGTEMTPLAYIGVLILTTGFGTWVGGMDGMAHSNKKLLPFKDAIDSGKYLILIYAKKQQEEKVIQMMKDAHPEATLAGVDPGFYNPFSRLELVDI